MDKITKIVITSGYYDPIHIGHIKYLEKARELGDYHIAIVNTDAQAKLKKGNSFMSEKERLGIVKALRCVDEVKLSEDEDRTQNKTLETLAKVHPKNFKLIFAKGGDYDGLILKCPEEEVCKKYNIEVVYGVGGNKIQSSSWLTKK